MLPQQTDGFYNGRDFKWFAKRINKWLGQDSRTELNHRARLQWEGLTKRGFMHSPVTHLVHVFVTSSDQCQTVPQKMRSTSMGACS